jgi:hypothetical protein
MVKIPALKPHLGPYGFVQVGDPVEVDPSRHRALARHGIVARPDGEDPAVDSRAGGAVTSGTFKQRREKITGDK